MTRLRAEDKRAATRLRKELVRLVTEDLAKAGDDADAVLDVALQARVVSWRLVKIAAKANAKARG